MSRLGPYLRGARAGIAVGVSIFAVGLAFGVFARGLGRGVLAPTAMSLAVFSGSAQFAVSTALVAALLINARFIPMGIASASSLRGGLVRRAVEGQAVVDAGWALASSLVNHHRRRSDQRLNESDRTTPGGKANASHTRPPSDCTHRTSHPHRASGHRHGGRSRTSVDGEDCRSPRCWRSLHKTPLDDDGDRPGNGDDRDAPLSRIVNTIRLDP
jgi:hypothetical protein